MMLFLKIVLAVILVIAVLIVAGLWFLKRWIKRAAGDYAAAAKIIDDRLMYPARIRLRRVRGIERSKTFDALWGELQEQGFRPMADFADQDEIFAVRAARLESRSVAAAVVQDASGIVSFTLFALTADNHLKAVSSEAGTEVRAPKLTWLIDESVSVATAVDRIDALTQSDELREMDVKLFRAAWEQGYASRTDRALAQKPTREYIAQLAAKQKPLPTEEQIDHAYDMVVGDWQSKVEDAVLDRFRRASKMDAVTWESVEDDLQIVHDFLTNEEIEDLLVEDEVGETLFAQCAAQGLVGVDLYEAVMSRLPGERRRERLGDVRKPVRAVIYGPAEHGDVPAAGQYVYQAKNAEGEDISGAVIAASSTDAKRQLADMGAENAALVIEPNPVDASATPWLDPEQAKSAAQACRESLLRSLLRALWTNSWIWGPPTALLAWTIWEGLPLGWGDYLVAVYALLAAAAMLFLIAPMVLYNQFLRARTAARWRSAKTYLWMLAKVVVFGGITKSTLLLERAKVLASQGQEEQAIALWRIQESELAKAEYLSGVSQIYDCSGNFEALVAAQRAVIDETPHNETAVMDLAMSLARRDEHVDEAESLVARFSPQDLSELAIAGYQYVRGLISARRGQHEQAMQHYAHAMDQLSQFKGNPLVLGLVAEMNGYAAVSLKRLGRDRDAEAIWGEVWPILQPHRGSERLLNEYQAT